MLLLLNCCPIALIRLLACLPPQSALERRMHQTRSGVMSSEGWFGACSRGAGSRDEAAGTSRAGRSGGPSSSDDFSGDGRIGCSEYVARLAEAVYSCTEQALAFLAATNPQVRGRPGAVSALLLTNWLTDSSHVV